MATIEIDGKTFDVENGKMIIEVADDAGIHIPRFCYHKKLSVAANCRMCLVEVANNRKTVPACATPITDGMKIFTKSTEALRSQRAVMEFLLINHPLDCPICDQGGECELQDLSMGFGTDASIYAESKRAVGPEDLGTLIATEMTRCIHCTRCVRFGDEVAGVRELGATGRGEAMEISTYVKHNMVSEVSGNVIDLCPVGALTSKPYRFTARAWELAQHASIAPHDCLGSNVYLHCRQNKVMRVVPKDNELINETWLSDRDRFSYLGINSAERALHPMIKRHGQWEIVDWETALQFAAAGIGRVIKQHGAEQMAAFASASSTLEESYLLQKLMRSLGVNNLDHRLQQTDFRDQDLTTVMPESTLQYADIERQAEIFVVGCNLVREVPLAALRVRKACKNGAKVYAINPVDYDFHLDVTAKTICAPQDMPLQIARILKSLIGVERQVTEDIQKLLIGLVVDEKTAMLAAALSRPGAVIITGALCENHPDAALLRTLIYLLAEFSGARIVRLTTGANSAGAALSGMLPHRGLAGKAVDAPGQDVQKALTEKLKGYVLMGVEPGFDFANPAVARTAMLTAEFVVVLSAFSSESIKDYADVILPMAPYAETSGTYINVDGLWQTVKGAVAPPGEARPAWKILRVLGNLFKSSDFEYQSSEDVLLAIKQEFAMMQPTKPKLFFPKTLPSNCESLVRVGEWPLYRSDSIVRAALELQECAAADRACIRVHPDTALRFSLGESAAVSQGDIEITLPLQRDERVAPDVVWVNCALPETADLGHAFAAITIKGL